MLKLRKLREEKRLNQQKLAMELNITQAAISKYELGLSEPDIEMLKNIASFFNVSVDYLIDYSDDICNNLPETTFKEQKLINNFRRLNNIQKEKVIAYIQGMLQE